jgi:hypothetical protein
MPASRARKWYAPDAYMLLLQDSRYDFAVLMAAMTNQWAHVVGVFDGTTRSVYIDGFPASMRAPGILHDSARPIEMSSHPTWNGDSGLIYETRLYDVALTAAQVQRLRQTSGPGH